MIGVSCRLDSTFRWGGVISSLLWLLAAVFVSMSPLAVCAGEPVHPSLLFSAEGIPALREKVKEGWLKQAFVVMKSRADQYMNVATSPYPMGRGLSRRSMG